jgi:hypothetical protein
MEHAQPLELTTRELDDDFFMYSYKVVLCPNKCVVFAGPEFVASCREAAIT